MKTKIIHILTHSPSPNAYRHFKEAKLPPEDYFIRIPEPPYWVGFFNVDWHVRCAEQLAKRTNDFEIECWRPYSPVNRVISKNINGITHRIFPSIKFEFGGKRVGEFSNSLISKLSREDPSTTIIHVHGKIGPLSLYIFNRFKEMKIVFCTLGGSSNTFLYLTEKSFLKRLPRFLLHKLETKIIGGVDIFWTGGKFDYIALKKYHNNIEFFHPNGIDFDIYTQDKKAARNKLQIPEDSKVILHVGRFDNTKGLSFMIPIFKLLKKSIDNLEFYVIGGYEEDSLFHSCKKNFTRTMQRIPFEELKPYYAAADVYVCLMFDKKTLGSGGIGISSIESIASNTPVVGNNLFHFKGNLERVGINPRRPGKVVESIKTALLENKYKNISVEAKQFYNWDYIMDHYINSYNSLITK